MKRTEVLQQINDGFSQLKRAMFSYTSAHMTDRNLSPAQLGTLKAIQFDQPITQKALAARMLMTPGAVSQLIDALDTAGCVVRTPSEADRRISYLSISREGKRTLQHYDKQRSKLITSATQDISDDDLQAYAKVQQALIDWLEKQK